MKETISLLIFFILCSITCNAQENEKAQITLSGYLDNYDQSHNYGLSFDIVGGKRDFWGICKEKNHFAAWVINLTVTNTDLKLDSALNTMKGYGVQFDTGYKGYLSPNTNYGFYFEYFLFNGGKYFFDETIYYTDGSEKKFKGTYSFASFLNPGIGYKIKFTQNISIDFDAGIFWRGMSEKTKGDIDDKMFKDFIPRLGFKAGWLF